MSSAKITDHEAIQTAVASVVHFIDHKQWRELRGLWKIRAMKLETFYQTGNLKLLEVAGGK